MISVRRWFSRLSSGLVSSSASKAVVYPVMVGVYAVVLFWVYSQLVTGPFAYLGYRFSEPTPLLMVLVWIVASLVALALPARLDRPSSVMIWILYAVTVAPTILMAPYTSYLDDPSAILLSVAVALVFAAVVLGQNPAPRSLRLSVSPRAIWVFLGVFSIATYAMLLVFQGIQVSPFNIDDIYGVREGFADEVGNVRILAYLVQTQANVVNPFIAAIGLVTRRWWVIAIAVAGQVLIYSTTGFKHVLFAILAWLVVVIILRRNGKRTRASVLVWGASALVLAAAAVDRATGGYLATSLFSRRFIFTPGLFTSVYAHFFSIHPQAHLGYSVLAPFVDYPYDTTPPFLIGEWMAGVPTMASNANLFADGFANFGLLGLVGAGAILLVYLRVLDRAAVGLPIVVSALVVVILAVALSNASILTSMFSHGLVAAVVLLAWMPRNTSFRPRPFTDPDFIASGLEHIHRRVGTR